VVRLLQKYERVEYRRGENGYDWHEQLIKTEVVGVPAHGVHLALFEASNDEMV